MTVSDGDGGSDTDSVAVTVTNVAPTIAISGNANVNEGSVYSLTLGAVTDPGTDTVSSYVVHWGDGNTDTYSTNGAKTHTYADGPNDYDVTVDLVDEDGTFLDAANALSVHVVNVAPTIAISGNANVNEGSLYTLTLGAVTDPGTDTVTSYVVHWGDGSDGHLHDERRQDAHLRRRRPTTTTSPSTWSTRTAPSSTRPTRSRCTSTTSRRRSRSAATRTSTRARPTA